MVQNIEDQRACQDQARSRFRVMFRVKARVWAFTGSRGSLKEREIERCGAGGEALGTNYESLTGTSVISLEIYVCVRLLFR